MLLSKKGYRCVNYACLWILQLLKQLVYLLFIFNEAASSSEYTESSDKIIVENQIEKDTADTVWPHVSSYPDIFLGGLNETTQNNMSRSQELRFEGKNSWIQTRSRSQDCYFQRCWMGTT